MVRLRTALGVLFLVGAAASLAFTAKTRPKSTMTYTTWAIYWDQKNVAPALLQYGPAFDEIASFAYHFDEQNRLVAAEPEVDALSTQLTVAPRPARRLLTLVNDIKTAQTTKLKDPALVHAAIGTPEARQAHIQQIMTLAASWDGIDVDYEKVAFDDSQAFTDFIRDLGQALKAQGKYLSVVVQPRTEEVATEPMQRNGTASINWAAIAPYVDQVKVMAYLYHFSTSPPGSVGPTDWVKQIAAYGLRQVPAEKLCILLHTGGLDWPVGKPGKSIEYPAASALAAAHGVTLQHDVEQGAGTFRYTDAEGVAHEVWVEDAAGLREKIKALRQMGIQHVGIWRLGTGDPAFWTWLLASTGR